MSITHGMNINGHLRATQGQPQDPGIFKGLGWVRVVLSYHAHVEPGNHSIHLFNHDLDATLRYYEELVDKYAAQGVRTLFVINQETTTDSYPPGDPHHAGGSFHQAQAWKNYGRAFGQFLEKVAQRFKNRNVGYEIWNEGDVPFGEPGASSVPVTAHNFAFLLDAAVKAIRKHDPDAPIIFGGLLSGGGDAGLYARQTKEALGGRLPVDGIGIHPYGQRAPGQAPSIGMWFSVFSQYVADFDRAYGESNMPLWITEVGIAQDTPIGAEHNPAIAYYVDSFLDHVENQFNRRVPVVIWFGWSDIMRNAGIVDRNGNPKEPIYSTYFEKVHAERSTKKEAEYFFQCDTDSTALYNHDYRQFSIVAEILEGSELEVLEDPDIALAKLGDNGQWIRVRASNGTEAYCAAWYLQAGRAAQGVVNNGKMPQPFRVRLLDGTGLLNMRSGQRGELATLTTIKRNAKLEVLENPVVAFAKVRSKAPDQWIYVLHTASGNEGWVLASDLKIAGNSKNPAMLQILERVVGQVFRLTWPTEFNHITQRFMERPEYYSQFGLPGHEGIDFQAPNGTKIFACADGIVIEKRLDGNTDRMNKPYGNQVRIQHDTLSGEFTTIYAHLQEVKVDVGDPVSAGQLIGLANSTGNTDGAHLHLTVKKKGATLNGETNFANDIIDPTPFLEPFGGVVKVEDRDDMQFLLDVTIPDHTIVQANTVFEKIWRVRNNGTTKWGEGYKLVLRSGVRMSKVTEIPLPEIETGQTIDLSVQMKAPDKPGSWNCLWQAQAPDGKTFGARVFVLIQVPGTIGNQPVGGILDMSHWNTVLSYKNMREKSNIIAILHKATQGTKFVDEQYKRRRFNAKKNGMLWGAYHFGTGSDPKEQAEHFLKTVRPDDQTILALDFERHPFGDSMTLAQAETFVQILRDKVGRWPMLYTGKWYLQQYLGSTDQTLLTRCPLWIASYQPSPDVPSQWQTWTMWQFTNGATSAEPERISGIRGRVDQNLYNGTLAELERFWGK